MYQARLGSGSSPGLSSLSMSVDKSAVADLLAGSHLSEHDCSSSDPVQAMQSVHQGARRQSEPLGQLKRSGKGVWLFTLPTLDGERVAGCATSGMPSRRVEQAWSESTATAPRTSQISVVQE